MRRRLYRHPRALSDVEESAVNIGADNIDAAIRFLDAVEATLRLLSSARDSMNDTLQVVRG